jgi:hypothetical protein
LQAGVRDVSQAPLADGGELDTVAGAAVADDGPQLRDLFLVAGWSVEGNCPAAGQSTRRRMRFPNGRSQPSRLTPFRGDIGCSTLRARRGRERTEYSLPQYDEAGSRRNPRDDRLVTIPDSRGAVRAEQGRPERAIPTGGRGDGRAVA